MPSHNNSQLLHTKEWTKKTELFQFQFIFWRFLFESRVIELRVKVKQNAKIRVFRVYSLVRQAQDVQEVWKVWKVWEVWEVWEVQNVRKLLMITLFMDGPFAVDGTMATSPSHQQGPYLYYVSKRTVWGGEDTPAQISFQQQ